MSDVKVAAAYVHVLGEDGEIVIIAPGEVIPAKIAGKVTNPAAFTTGRASAPAPVAPTAPAPAAPAPVAPAAPTEAAPAAAAEPTAPADSAVKDYTEQSFAELQATAKARGLSGQGNKETLIARLEADDREKAAGAEAEALKTAADVVATTGTTSE